MLTTSELRDLIFEKLYAELTEGQAEPKAFVGVQGDAIVVMQPGGEHLAVRVVEAKVAVAGG